MKKHVAEFIVESAAKRSWSTLSIIEIRDEEYGLQGTQEQLFRCIACNMLDFLNCIYEDIEDYYERLEVIEVFENLKQAKVGDNDVWY